MSHTYRSQSQPGVVCGECDRKCQSESRNPAVVSEESQTSVCNLCGSSLKAPVRLGEHLSPEVREEEGRSHHKDTHGGALKDQPANPDQQKDFRCCDLVKDAAHEDDDVTDRHGRHDEDSRSTVTKISHANSEKAQAEDRLMEYTCSSSPSLTTKDATKKSSASARRALFARRRLNTSASTSSGASHSPRTQSPISGREPSPPRTPSPRPHQCPAPPSSLSISTCPVSSVLNTAASSVRIHTEGSDSSGLPGCPAGRSAQCPTCSQPKDLGPAAILLGEGTSLIPITSHHPTRPQGYNKLLSHLPLHSQQPSRTPSLLIPIGGIHMVQPRSTLPLYSLVSSRMASSVPSGAPIGKLAVPQQQDTHKEMLPSSRGGPLSPQAAQQTPAGDKSLTAQQPSASMTGTERTERHVYTKGQNTSASSQKQL